MKKEAKRRPQFEGGESWDDASRRHAAKDRPLGRRQNWMDYLAGGEPEEEDAETEREIVFEQDEELDPEGASRVGHAEDLPHVNLGRSGHSNEPTDDERRAQ